MDPVINLSAAGITNLSKIGSGTYGNVYSGEKDGTLIAIKYIPDSSGERLVTSIPEIDIESRIANNYVLRTQGVYFAEYLNLDGFINLMPFTPGTSRMLAFNNYTFENRLSFLRKAAEGMDCLHRAGILHLDLKVENILSQSVTIQYEGKEYNILEPLITDFGLSTAVKSIIDGKTIQGQLGTPKTRAPEHFAQYSGDKAQRQIYRGATDVWAFGTIIYTLLTGRNFFPDDIRSASYPPEETFRYLEDNYSTQEKRDNILRLALNDSTRIPPQKMTDAYALINSCLQWDFRQRTTFREIVKLPLFDFIVTKFSECNVVNPYVPEVTSDMSLPAIRNCVKNVVIWLVRGSINHLSLSILYHSVDICYRYALTMNSFELGEVAKMNQLGLASILIAVKYYGYKYSFSNLISSTKTHNLGVTLEQIRAMEENIARRFGLIFYRRFLYDSIRSLEDVTFHYENLLLNPSNYYRLKLAHKSNVVLPAVIPAQGDILINPVAPLSYSNPSVAYLTMADLFSQRA